MPFNCEKLRSLISAFSLVIRCDIVKSDVLRIATPFKYPDGSLIDVFLKQDAGLVGATSLFKGFVLSDYGRTSIFLRNLNVKMMATKKRRRIVEDVCATLDVETSKNELMIRFQDDNAQGIPDAISRLAQACIRVADLSFSQRFAVGTPFKEEVEEFFSSNNIEYEADVTIPGAYGGREVPIDFKLTGKGRTSLVKTLSTGNPATAHTLMNEILTCWIDLQHIKDSKNQFITLLDDTIKYDRPPDTERLSTFSPLFGFPSQQDQLLVETKA